MSAATSHVIAKRSDWLAHVAATILLTWIILGSLLL
jgi:hypothetical protein